MTAQATPEPDTVERALDQPPVLAAVVLAAGASRRFGTRDKLCEPLRGKALVLHPVDAALEAGFHVVVVVPAGAACVREYLAGRRVEVCENPVATDGIGGSVAAGVGALDAAVTGAAILPGDMPNVTPDMLRRLADAFKATEARCVVVPVTAGGEQRNPVLWPRPWFARLMTLRGDRGAKALIPTDRDQRCDVVFPDDLEFFDVDTPADLTRLR